MVKIEERLLIGLREFQKNKVSKSGKQYDLRPGDIVLIENKGAHRVMWKKAKVLKLSGDPIPLLEE